MASPRRDLIASMSFSATSCLRRLFQHPLHRQLLRQLCSHSSQHHQGFLRSQYPLLPPLDPSPIAKRWNDRRGGKADLQRTVQDQADEKEAWSLMKRDAYVPAASLWDLHWMVYYIWREQHALLPWRKFGCMVYHYAQSHTQARNMRCYIILGLVPCGLTVPFSFLECFDFECAVLIFSFQLFDFSTFRPWTSPSSPLAHLFRYRPPLVACYTSSEAPEPLFTSVLCGCYRLHRCRKMWLLEKNLGVPPKPQSLR